MIAFDTNLLVHAHRAATPEHPAAVQALKAASRNVHGWGYQIGLICREAGATELWTHDRDFVALPGLKVFDPLA